MQNQIPNNWQKVRIGEIAENFDSKRIPLSSIERSKRKGNIPYYGASGIIDYVNNYLFDGEYLLISEDGENLKSRNTPIAFLTKGKFWVNNHAHIIKSKNDFDNKLIRYWFSQNSILPFITGSAQPKLNQENLNAIELLWPEESIRKNIAKVLSSFDDKIEINNKIAKTLENIASKIFKKFIENSNFINTLNLIKIADIIKGKKPKNIFTKRMDNSKEYLLIESFTGNKKFYTNDYKVPQSLKYEPVIVMDGASSGKVFIGKDGFVGSTLAVVKVKQEYLNLKLFILFFIKNIESILISNYTGSAIPHVDRNLLVNYEVPILKNEIIERFNRLITPVIKKQEIVKKENQKLAEMRDLLLPKLMKGEIRIQ